MAELFWSQIEIDNSIIEISTDEISVKSILFVTKGNDIQQTSEYLPQIMIDTQTQLTEYFNETRQEFTLPLLPEGTEFQKKVWKQLLKIPYGHTITYQEMAHKLGDPKVIRAAAAANGKNPIAIVIPCHRVIGTNGRLTGYAGGLGNKQKLLDLENKVKNGVLDLF